MIDIKDISGKTLFPIQENENTVFVEELMSSDYIRLSWHSDKGESIPVSSYIEYDGEKYRLLETYTPQMENEAEYVYTPEFNSRVIAWGKQIVPVYTYDVDGTTVKTREMDWEFTGSPLDAMFMVKQAIKNETGEDWTVQLSDNLPATISISSQSASILSVLNSIADECETEWWADKKTNTLYLSKCVKGEPITLEVGKHVGVPSVTDNSEGYYTRFYAFGSTRNIEQESLEGGARVNKRLTLDPVKYPYGYKDIRPGLSQEEVFVKVLYYDKIYPSSKLTISDVRARLRYRVDNEGNRIRIGGTDEEPVYEQYAIWYFRIAGFAFNPDTIIEGKILSVSFESGQLAGRDFELEYHEKAETVKDGNDVTPFEVKSGDYEIIIDESTGSIIPGLSYIIPQNGDSVILYNIVMPEEYTKSAQDELEEELDKYIAKQEEDNRIYKVSSNPVYFYENKTDLRLGQSVTFVYGGMSVSTRIQSVEKRLDLPCYQDIGLGNKVVKGVIQKLKEDVAYTNQQIDIIKAFNELSVSLTNAYANAQREMIEGFAAIKKLWSLKEDDEGNQYAYTKFPIVGAAGMTMFDSIFKGLPLDTTTLQWVDGVLTVVGGGTGGGASNWDELEGKPSWITDTKPVYTWGEITQKPTTLSGYGIQASDVLNVLKTVDGSGSGLDADTLDGKHYIDIINGNVASATKLQTARTIWGQSFDGTANVTGSLTSVTDITGTGTFTGANIKATDSVYVNGIRLHKTADGVITLEGNLAVTGGITAYSTGEEGGSSGGGGIDVELLWEILGGTGTQQINVTHLTGALTWNNVSSKPSWIGDTKPSYVWSEILAKPTTLAGFGITDAYNKSESDGRYLYKYSNNYSGDVRNIPINTFVSAQNMNITNAPSDLYSVAWSDILTFSWNDNSQYKEQLLISNGRLYSQGGYGGGWSKIAFITDNVASSSRLTTDAGSSVNPVYFANGIPVRTSYSFGNSSGNAAINNGTLCSNLNADMLDGLHYTQFIYKYSLTLGISDDVFSIPSYTCFSGINMINSPSSDWLTGLVLAKNGNDYYKEIIGISSGRLYTNYAGNSSWKTVAFLTDNVASATKLQTARTLWGQSFDGTANVSGDISGANDIVATGIISAYSIELSASTPYIDFHYGYLEEDYTGRIIAEPDYRLNINYSMYIIRYGNVGIGTTSPSQKLHVSGNILATGGGTFYSSDIRAKNVIESLKIKLNDIANAPVIKFRWNGYNGLKDDNKLHVGGIAQYIEKILPECVVGQKDDFLSFDYATVGYIFSVQTARHLQSYETKTDREIKKLKNRITFLEKQLKKVRL